jgi:cell division protein FtsL
VSTVVESRLGHRGRTRAIRAPFAGGVVGIGLLALLLAGVVALNVIVLRLNVRYDELGRQRAQLQADVAQLQAQLSSASANERIETMARNRLGLVPVGPDQTSYVRLTAPKR